MQIRKGLIKEDLQLKRISDNKDVNHCLYLGNVKDTLKFNDHLIEKVKPFKPVENEMRWDSVQDKLAVHSIIDHAKKFDLHTL